MICFVIDFKTIEKSSEKLGSCERRKENKIYLARSVRLGVGGRRRRRRDGGGWSCSHGRGGQDSRFLHYVWAENSDSWDLAQGLGNFLGKIKAEKFERESYRQVGLRRQHKYIGGSISVRIFTRQLLPLLSQNEITFLPSSVVGIFFIFI